MRQPPEVTADDQQRLFLRAILMNDLLIRHHAVLVQIESQIVLIVKISDLA